MEDIFSKLAAVKKDLEASMSRGRKIVGAKFWRAKNGKNHIRISPAWTDSGSFAGQWWREVAQHWGVNEDERGPVVCRARTPFLEGDCPVCDFIEKLKAEKGNPAAAQLAHELRPKKAFFLSIVDLDDPVYTDQDVADYAEANPDRDAPYASGDVKVQVYAAPPTVFDGISDIVISNNLDITKLDTGYNVFVTKHAASANSRYTRYDVTPEMKPSASLVTDPEKLPALDKVGKLHERDEVLSLISTGVGAQMVLGGTTQAVSLPASTPTPAAAPTGDIASLGDSVQSVEDLQAMIEAQLQKK